MAILEKNNYWEFFTKIWNNIPQIIEVYNQIKSGTYQSKLTTPTHTFAFVYPLLRALLHFYLIVEKTVKNQEERKKMLVFITKTMTKITTVVPVCEENESDLEELQKLCQKFHCRFQGNVESGRLLANIEILMLNVYRKLIETSSF